MPREINFKTVYTRGEDGTPIPIPALMGGGDAAVTKESVTNALGYTAADDSELKALDQRALFINEQDPQEIVDVPTWAEHEALANTIVNGLNEKLDANQGTANAGKQLVVGDDGAITLDKIASSRMYRKLTVDMFGIASVNYNPFNWVSTTSRTMSVMMKNNGDVVIAKSDAMIWVSEFDENYSQTAWSKWVTEWAPTAPYYNVCVRYSDDRVLTDIAALIELVSIETDITLTKQPTGIVRDFPLTRRTVADNGGKYFDSETRLATDMLHFRAGDKIDIDGGHKCRICKYNAPTMSTGNYIGRTEYFNGEYVFEEDTYAILLLANILNTTISGVSSSDFCTITTAPIAYEKLGNVEQPHFVIGTLLDTGRRRAFRNDRIASDMLYFENGGRITVESGYRVNIYYYSGHSLGSFIKRSEWQDVREVGFPAGTYCIITVATTNNAVIDVPAMEFAKHVNVSGWSIGRPVPDYSSLLSGAAIDTRFYGADDIPHDGVADCEASEVHRMFDELAAASPQANIGRVLGYATAADGSEDKTHPIMEYTFRARSEAANGGSEFSRAPVILIGCCVHGGTEKSTVFSAYDFLHRAYVEQVDELAYLRNNTTVKIIPVCNPGGFDAGTRTNAHGVNLGRNLSEDWESGTNAAGTEYRGTAPYSEYESKVLKAWLEENADALLLVDFHNCFAAEELSYVSSHEPEMVDIIAAVYRDLTDYWVRKYNLLDDGKMLGRDSQYERHACLADEASRLNIKHHALVEINAYGVDRSEEYNTSAFAMGHDLLANFIRAVVMSEAASGESNGSAAGVVEVINNQPINVDATLTEVGKAADAATVGQKIKALEESGGSSGVSDVQVNGTSVVAGGVANVPMTSKSTVGAIRLGQGFSNPADGGIVNLDWAYNADITSRGLTKVMRANNIDYAVKAAMCDGKGAVWTAEEQAAAQQRLGLDWHTVTATEADFYEDGNYHVLKIVPPEGMRFDEIRFTFQIARDEVGTETAQTKIGIHEALSDSGYFLVAHSISPTWLWFAASGTITTIGDYDMTFVGAVGGSAGSMPNLPFNNYFGTAAMRSIHTNIRPSRVLTFGIPNSFALNRAYLHAKYRLEKAD